MPPFTLSGEIQNMSAEQAAAPWKLIDFPKVFRWCPDPACGTERPFYRVEQAVLADSENLHGSESTSRTAAAYTGSSFHREPYPTGNEDTYSPVYSLYFLCSGCGRSEFRCWIETNLPEWLRKVGQVPSWNPTVPKNVADALGEDADLYRKARICMGQSYGIGACTYLRRTLESQIQPLLEIAIASREEEGAPDEELEQMRNAIEGRTAEQKIRLANRLLPATIAVEGDNPLQLIYDRLSAGVHRLDDQECMEIALRTAEVLEYVVTTLDTARRRRQSKKQYTESLRSLRKFQ